MSPSTMIHFILKSALYNVEHVPQLLHCVHVWRLLTATLGELPWFCVCDSLANKSHYRMDEG